MLKKERQDYILHRVNLHNKVLSSLLSQSARKTVCLTISEKINTLQPIHICDIQQIDVLITELPPDDPRLRPYFDLGIQVL
jgi:DeoR/GlpR family transcriptional regulator of sugar metabolism